MRVLDILKIEEPQQGDTFDIEISESEMITTGIVDLVEDGIVIHADEYLFGLLANTGLLEDIRVPVKQKPRQGPLRPQTGGGAHRDKKKEQKQGKEKHKGKPLGEGSEHEVKQNLIKHIMDMDPNMELNYLEMATIEELAEILGKMSDSVGEASNQRDKRNPTRDHLRRYPVPQDQMARPVKKKTEPGMAENEGLVGEAEYQGRNVPLGKPMAGDVKKSKVYVKGPKGNVVKVNFGDKKMRIKKSNPNRRKSFRARHNCDNPGPRWKARYWSCRAW